MTADALVEAPPLELPFTVDVVGRLDDRERLGVAPSRARNCTRSRLIASAEDAPSAASRSRSAPAKSPCTSRSLDQCARIRRVRGASRSASAKAALRLGGACLLHQVDREVRKRPRVRPSGLERAPEMPFPRRKVVFHGPTDVPNWSCASAFFGIGDDGAARDDERIRMSAVIRQQGDEIDEGPVSAAIACNDVGQRLRGPSHVPACNRIAHRRGCRLNRPGHLVRVPPGKMT